MSNPNYHPILLILLVSLNSWAQYPQLSTSPASRAKLTETVNQIYNFQFTKAEATLSELNRTYPDHPVIPLLQAVNSYWQWFPARTDTRLEQRIRDQLSKAANDSGAWLNQQKRRNAKNNPEALYIYFSAEALLAKLDNFAHAKLASVGHAKNAYPYIHTCIDLQQQYPDFLLVAGLYDYYREEYPQIHPFYKPLVWFMKPGDKQRGIAQLTSASRQSLFSRAEAGYYLAHVLADFEQKPALAIAPLQDLLKVYPDNHYLRAKLAEVTLSANRPAQALPYIKALLVDSLPAYRLFGKLDQARYWLLTGHLAEAQVGALAILAANPKDETLLAFGNQVLAQVCKQRGQKEQARAYYQKVIDGSEYPILRDEAEEYLKNN
ncbi:lipopolysaccharide assembly protein LapB [Larkinella sp. C7]|uniref:tetratricopeptide repeat protein n=1 Tax=Larkinella sp. C7 TaxID=2576607 RepID=UPI0011111B00|nr:tetratricopeptide repeat protein [Larkinella sp. C7]